MSGKAKSSGESTHEITKLKHIKKSQNNLYRFYGYIMHYFRIGLIKISSSFVKYYLYSSGILSISVFATSNSASSLSLQSISSMLVESLFLFYLFKLLFENIQSSINYIYLCYLFLYFKLVFNLRYPTYF